MTKPHNVAPTATHRVMTIARFGVVGLCGTALYFGLAVGLVQAGLHILAAHGVAYAVSILFSYLGQKIFTFGIRGGHRQAGPRFLLATALIAGVQFALVAVLKNAGAPDIATLAISTLYYPIASFLVHNFWTFKQPAIKGAP